MSQWGLFPGMYEGMWLNWALKDEQDEDKWGALGMVWILEEDAQKPDLDFYLKEMVLKTQR